MNLSIIIPCYNEEDGLANLASQLLPIVEELSKIHSTEVIFVDDGSTDDTYVQLKKYFGETAGIKIIRHEQNKNVGGSLRTGFQNSTGDVIITMDSDCTYPPEAIFQLLEMLDEDTDVVTASPYHPLGRVENIPPYRLFLSKSISYIYSKLTGYRVHTFTALFRAQKRHVVQNVNFRSDDFLATAEMLIYSLMKGYKVKEFSTTLRVRQFGESKMKLYSVIKSHAKFVLEIAGKRLRGNFKK